MPARPVSKQKQLRDDYAFVFGSEVGKRVLDDLALNCGIFAAIDANHQPIDQTTLAYREGRRSIWLHIFGNIHTRRELPQAIQEEHRDLLSMVD